jgi:uncharacterized alpha-E superfamily protein
MTAMLSRIAESLFWIGRYVERADDTARILDAYVHRILEDPWADEEASCRSLLRILGVPQPQVVVGSATVLELLAFDPTTPSAIAGAWHAARENARGAREIISSELWEALNATWVAFPQQRVASQRLGPHALLGFVRERAAMVNGLAESTMSHDDGWRFLVLGRSLERVDMTARLLSTRVLAADHAPSWTTLLQACGADETFLRTYRGALDAGHIAEFLLLDRLFPRSVFAALVEAERCLLELEPDVGRAGVGDPARRIVGRARTGLEYVDAGVLLAELPEHLERIQAASLEASAAVAKRYFQYAAPVAWLHEEG